MYRKIKKTWHLPISLLYMMRPNKQTRTWLKDFVKFNMHHINFLHIWVFKGPFILSKASVKPGKFPSLMFLGIPVYFIYLILHIHDNFAYQLKIHEKYIYFIKTLTIQDNLNELFTAKIQLLFKILIIYTSGYFRSSVRTLQGIC